jgi:putative MATE family efflux protein
MKPEEQRAKDGPPDSASRAPAPALPLLKMVWPMAVAALSQILLAFADVAIVGHAPGLPLAAVGTGAALYVVCTQAVAASALGYQILAARAFGAGDRTRVAELLGAAARLSLGFAAVLALLLNLLGQPLVALLVHDPATATAAVGWLRLRAPGLLFYAAAVLLRMTLDADQQPRWGMLVALSQNSVNAVATWLLVFGSLGFPALGVAGSALGSTIADVLALVLMLVIHVRRRPLRYRAALAARGADVRAVLALSGPEVTNATLDYLGGTAFVAVVAVLGDVSLAAHQVAYTVMTILFAFALVVSSAVQILSGRAMGGAQRLEAGDRAREALKATAPVFVVVGLAVFLFPTPIAGVFARSGATVAAAAGAMRVVAVSAPLMIYTTILVGVLRAAKRSRLVMRINIACVWLVELPVALVLSSLLHWGLVGAYGGFLAYFTARAAMTTVAAAPLLRGRENRPPLASWRPGRAGSIRSRR